MVVRAAEREHPDVECSSSNVGAAPPARQSRRTLLGIAAGAAAALAARAPPARAEPYLLSTGAKGILAEEEAKLLQLRRDLEGEVRRELEAERVLLENEARNSSVGKLCATPFGIDIVGITEFVALAGALVGGITARQRKNELERLNEQLRKVNMGLRQQARAGMVYAPGLTYVPPAAPASQSGGCGRDGDGAADASGGRRGGGSGGGGRCGVGASAGQDAAVYGGRRTQHGPDAVQGLSAPGEAAAEGKERRRRHGAL